MDHKTGYNFTKQGQGEWSVQDDVVMGGCSTSGLEMTPDGKARFSGHISLENNGGFCSIHQKTETSPYIIHGKGEAFLIRLKADGKDYSFRIRTPNGRHSYAFTFGTKADGSWETILIPFDLMEARFRGTSVDVPNYRGEDIVEMRILIGNGRQETFEIFLESIVISSL